MLRERAGASSSSKSRKREDEKREKELLAQATDADARREALTSGPLSSSLGTGKHINLFEDLEQVHIVAEGRGFNLTVFPFRTPQPRLSQSQRLWRTSGRARRLRLRRWKKASH